MTVAPQPRERNGEFGFKTFAADEILLAGTTAPGGLVNPEDTLNVPHEDRIGLHYQGLREIDGENVEVWTSGNGSYEVETWKDGHTQFTFDGDLHRVGGPAVIGADGREDWFRRGTFIQAARPFPPTSVTDSGEGDKATTRFTGVKHIADRRMRFVADEIRRDLDTLSDIGFLPAGSTVNVTSTSGAKGKSVNVAIGGLAMGYAVDPETLEFTPEGRKLRDHVDAVVQQYNRWEEGPSASHSRRGFWNEVHLLEDD